MTAGSPQGAWIADAIARTRASQPGQRFFDLGDVLATPELSVQSPWLNLGSPIQLELGITDEAYEIIALQLLPRLRPDSVGTITQSNADWHIQFTGFDGYPYAVQVSTNLMAWTSVSTNYPADGVFDFTVTPSSGPEEVFFRSVLLP